MCASPAFIVVGVLGEVWSCFVFFVVLGSFIQIFRVFGFGLLDLKYKHSGFSAPGARV